MQTENDIETACAMPIKPVKGLPRKVESELVQPEPFKLAARKITDETETRQLPVRLVSARELLPALGVAVALRLIVVLRLADLRASAVELPSARTALGYLFKHFGLLWLGRELLPEIRKVKLIFDF